MLNFNKKKTIYLILIIFKGEKIGKMTLKHIKKIIEKVIKVIANVIHIRRCGCTNHMIFCDFISLNNTSFFLPINYCTDDNNFKLLI